MITIVFNVIQRKKRKIQAISYFPKYIRIILSRVHVSQAPAAIQDDKCPCFYLCIAP